MNKIIITAPSLDPSQNVSGVSSVAQFIIENNPECEYLHFELGKKDKEKRGLSNISRLLKCYEKWKEVIDESVEARDFRRERRGERREVGDEGLETRDERLETRGERVIVHYSFPLNTPSIIRDPFFMNYARKRGVKMVVHIHGGLFLTAPKIPYVLKKILKWVFSWDVPFIVLSEMEKDILEKKFGAKWVEVLPNCPEESREVGDESGETRDERLETRDESGETREERREWGDESGEMEVVSLREDGSSELEEGLGDAQSGERPLVLGYLGRIEPLKGMSELLEACKRLKADGVPFKLIFAGKEKNEGEYLPIYEKLNDNEKWFEYVGLVSGESKREFLRKLDVFVMPSYFEGLPMSLLETMSYGVVPVVTPVGSIPVVVRDFRGEVGDERREMRDESGETRGANGLFVKVRDVDSIVEAVKILHNDRGLLGRLGKNAKRYIDENFSAKAYIKKLNEIYEKV